MSDQVASTFDFEAAAKLPANILFGTSSWTYPGWNGMVYHQQYKSEREFNACCLKEYAAFPWFRTVGVDSSFYNPLSRKILEQYSASVPPAFKWASKVWEEITVPCYANHKRYGAKAGKDNPNFLNAGLFVERVLGPYKEAGLEQHCGPLIFEFQTMPMRAESQALEFIEKLKTFLSLLPPDFPYAVEIRNRNLLIPAYFEMLNSAGAAHCFNHWSAMPPLRDQMKAAAAGGGINAKFFVARILTPLGVKYQEAVDRYAPYDSIKEPLPEMREDVLRLARRAIQRKIDVYILVNNRAEGNAPMTIDAIGRKIAGEQGAANEETDAEASA